MKETSKKGIERKINEIYKVGDNEIICLWSYTGGCKDCMYAASGNGCTRDNNVDGECFSGYRKDKRDVIFKVIKEDQNEKKI